MKTRSEAVKKIEQLLDSRKGELLEDSDFAKEGVGIYDEWHFGVVELRVFLDWLYEGKPNGVGEKLYRP